MTIWHDIREVKPPANFKVIGIYRWPMNPDAGVICGELYDMQPNALIDRQRGRWMEITHWAYQPGDEPNETLNNQRSTAH